MTCKAQCGGAVTSSPASLPAHSAHPSAQPPCSPHSGRAPPTPHGLSQFSAHVAFLLPSKFYIRVTSRRSSSPRHFTLQPYPHTSKPHDTAVFPRSMYQHLTDSVLCLLPDEAPTLSNCAGSPVRGRRESGVSEGNAAPPKATHTAWAGSNPVVQPHHLPGPGQ